MWKNSIERSYQINRIFRIGSTSILALSDKRHLPSLHALVGRQFFILCSLHNVHEMNAYRAGHVCLHDSTRELLAGFG
jgi:hypothetical protein